MKIGDGSITPTPAEMASSSFDFDLNGDDDDDDDNNNDDASMVNGIDAFVTNFECKL